MGFWRIRFQKVGIIFTVGRLEFSATAEVLTGGLSIEAGIDWVYPRVPFRVSAHIQGLNIETGIDWVYPRVPFRVSVHIPDRIASNLSSLKLPDFDYSPDQFH